MCRGTQVTAWICVARHNCWIAYRRLVRVHVIHDERLIRPPQGQHFQPEVREGEQVHRTPVRLFRCRAQNLAYLNPGKYAASASNNFIVISLISAGEQTAAVNGSSRSA